MGDGKADCVADAPTQSASTEISTIGELVGIATKYCLGANKDPLAVAVEVLSRTKGIPKSMLITLAQTGLASLVRDRIRVDRSPGPRTYAPRADPKEVESLAAKRRKDATERRAELYNNIAAALAARYKGADGKERALLDFTVSDHNHRMGVVLYEADLMKKHGEFHDSAVRALTLAKVDTIKDLPASERLRLAGLLR